MEGEDREGLVFVLKSNLDGAEDDGQKRPLFAGSHHHVSKEGQQAWFAGHAHDFAELPQWSAATRARSSRWRGNVAMDVSLLSRNELCTLIQSTRYIQQCLSV